MTRALLAVTLVGLLGTGCGSSTTAPTTTTATTTQPVTELFTGSLAVQGSAFYSFSVAQAGTVSITLVGLTSGTTAFSTVVTLGYGIPSGTGCALSTSTKTAPALVAQIKSEAAIGIYCASLADVGNLSDTTNFTVRIVHP
jgi:hypothetical protein